MYLERAGHDAGGLGRRWRPHVERLPLRRWAQVHDGPRGVSCWTLSRWSAGSIGCARPGHPTGSPMPAKRPPADAELLPLRMDALNDIAVAVRRLLQAGVLRLTLGQNHPAAGVVFLRPAARVG